MEEILYLHTCAIASMLHPLQVSCHLCACGEEHFQPFVCMCMYIAQLQLSTLRICQSTGILSDGLVFAL